MLKRTTTATTAVPPTSGHTLYIGGIYEKNLPSSAETVDR